jgi:hypothetical protein
MMTSDSAISDDWYYFLKDGTVTQKMQSSSCHKKNDVPEKVQREEGKLGSALSMTPTLLHQ